MESDDPLLSAVQVARLYGTGITTVRDLVEEGALATLDGGRLIAAGRLDVPVIRQSWAEALQTPSDAASRVVHPPAGEVLHPAVVAAADLFMALQDADADAASSLTSVKSREGLKPAEVLAAWLDALGGRPPATDGIGSVVYSLAPLDALAARIFIEAPKLPRVMDKPTPARMRGALPMVAEGDNWRGDLQLARESSSWIDVLYARFGQSEADAVEVVELADSATASSRSRK